MDGFGAFKSRSTAVFGFLSGLAHDRPGDKYRSADISFFCDKKRRLRKGCSICDR